MNIEFFSLKGDPIIAMDFIQEGEIYQLKYLLDVYQVHLYKLGQMVLCH